MGQKARELIFTLGAQPVFKVRGFQDELEVLIRTHLDVDEVCVLGVPDLYSGEVPVALVVLGDEAKERIEEGGKEVQKITVSILKVRPRTLHRPTGTIISFPPARS